MYDTQLQSTHSIIEEYRDRRTAVGFLAYSLATVALVAAVVAPGFVLGVAMGAALVRLAPRVTEALRDRHGGGGLLPPAESPDPTRR